MLSLPPNTKGLVGVSMWSVHRVLPLFGNINKHLRVKETWQYTMFRSLWWICESTYSKVAVVSQKTGFWVAKSKISKYGPKVNFEIAHILESSILCNLQYLSLNNLNDLVQKQCFHVKLDLWIDKIPILCADFQILRTFFLKINFSPICYDILHEIAISQERNV